MNTLAFALVEHLKAVTARYCAPSGELLQTRCCICSVSCYCPVPSVPVNAGKTILQIREHLKFVGVVDPWAAQTKNSVTHISDLNTARRSFRPNFLKLVQ
ncbi:hypothetical protein C2845_PM18G02600 [Panicum miliaceum]|uniref:Uncharacterized protein n=1 Tax=Panicum miliaceum TaxID=4540 RepID=A0A3L6PJU8_PANMI|nr:hypothetical protein C2845_PM18G02600 [Panicum miliaceum]